MDKQEIFNIVVRGLRSQGWRRSTNEKYIDCGNGSGCVYRSPEGLKCAFGHLISNKDYDSKMEGMSAMVLISNYNKFEKYLPYINFISDLQKQHDRHSSPEEMEEVFKLLAKNNNLTWPEG